MLEKPSLIMTIGISGSGKTTWILNNTDSNTVVISPDSIRQEICGDISDQSKNGEVWSIAKKRVSEALILNKKVILDATNTISKSRKQFLKGLPENNLFAKRFEVDPKIAKSRIKNQIENKELRSNVPDRVVDRQFIQFSKDSSVQQLIEEGFEIL